MPLCKICKDTLESTVWQYRLQYTGVRSRGLPGVSPEPHHPSLQTFFNSVQENCYVCVRALRQLDGQMQDWFSDMASLFKQYGQLIGSPGGKQSPGASSGKPISRRTICVTSLRVLPKVPVPSLSFEISLYGLRQYLASLERDVAPEAAAQAHLATLILRLEKSSSSLNWPQDWWMDGLIPMSMVGE